MQDSGTTVAAPFHCQDQTFPIYIRECHFLTYKVNSIKYLMTENKHENPNFIIYPHPQLRFS